MAAHEPQRPARANVEVNGRFACLSFHRAIRASLVVAALAAIASPAATQTVDPNLYVANSTVFSSAVSGNTLYLGGQFTRVGVASGGAVPVDATTGAPIPGFPRVVGSINAIAPDGSGGWYVGGSFSQIGGVARNNAARIHSDYTVDPLWNPAPNSVVQAVTVAGSTVYLGGAFTTVGGQPRNRIASVDPVSGAVTFWDPNANSSVLTIVVNGSIVYAGGLFTTIGGQTRNRIAALDAATALATTWDPLMTGTSVRALAVSGSLVYVGGQFTAIGGQLRNRIAALDQTTALATGWDPNANSNVFALAVDGSTVYAGGAFTVIGGQLRIRVAAIDAATGLATAWNPSADAGVSVNALVISGSQVYIGGSFGTVGGIDRNGAAAIDITTGAATSWNPAPCGPVNAVAVSGSSVYLGGSFVCINSVPRLSLAAIDLTTGMPTPWNPGANGTVQSIVVGGDGTVYVGGLFTFAGGQPRSRLAAIDANGSVTAWNPGADNIVFALASDGSTLYAGGTFLNVGGQPRSRLAAIDASGSVTPWNPGADNTVSALALGGSTVYAGGTFLNVGGQPRQRIAAIDAGGSVTAWNPGADNTVSALAFGGSTLYAGGNFMSIGGQSRPRVAALDVASGTATGWNPGADNPVLALALDGPVLYMGGSFTTVLGPRNRAAAVLTGSGHLAPWNPNMGGQVNTLALGPSSVIAGGAFSTVGGVPRATVASMSRQAAHAITATAGPGGTILPSGVVGALEGAFQGFTITPDAGYMITDVLVDGSSVGSVTGYTIGPVTSNRTIAASFAPNVRTLTTTVSPAVGGSVTRSPDQASYAFGSTVDLTAVPAANFQFSGWSGDLSGTDNPASLLMDGDKSIVANFVYTGPPVSLQQGPGGSDETSENGAPWEEWFDPNPGTTPALTGEHLLISEFSIAPSEHEMIELHNPTAYPYDLSNFYLTDAIGGGLQPAIRSYWNLPHGDFVPLGGDFCVHFPLGATIPAGGTLVIALNGAGLEARFGPGIVDYEILPSSSGIPDMVPAVAHALIPGTNMLDDDAEFLMLFHWDGASDNVCDIDYIPWNGSGASGFVNKTGRAVDGPDADLAATTYFPDTPLGSQTWLYPPGEGVSMARAEGAEGAETASGGNGCSSCSQAAALVVVATPTAGGSVSRNPTQTVFNPGESVVLTATAAPLYNFVGWGGDASGSDNPLTVVMDDCKSITAIFQLNAYALNVTTVGGGTVARNPNQALYNHGTSVQLTATAAPGYTFTGWSGDASGTTNPLTVVMNGTRNITATFTLNTYALGLTVTGTGTVSRSPDQPVYDHGTTVEVTAAAGVGNTFTSWTGDTTGATNPLAVMMNRAKNITANFTINSYALGVSVVGGGAVARSPNQALYNHGTAVELTATANTGYTFSGWSGDATGTANPITVSMDGAKNVTAAFTINTYALSVSVGAGGAIARDPDQLSYEHGSTVQLTATPDPGYAFAGWDGDASGTANPLSITMSGPRTLTATFLDLSNSLLVTTTVTLGSPAAYDQVVVTETGHLVANAPLTVNGNMTVQPGGVVSHSRGVPGGLDLTVGGRLWLRRAGAAGRIDVVGQGLLGGSRFAPACDHRTGQTYDALGNVTCSGGSSGSAGGSYGGVGGTGFAGGGPGAAYGLAEDPAHLGSGGGSEGVYVDLAHAGGNGGGLVRIIADSVIVDGEISADGGSVPGANCGAAYNGMAGGSGGGIKVVANVFRGGPTGSVHANGGFGYCGDTGGGGGGRIAIWADDQSGWLGTLDVRGGYLNLVRNTASSGTIYRSARDGSGHSADLLLTNAGRLSSSFTPLSTQQSHLRTVRVQNNATLAQGTTPGATLEVDQDVRVETGAIYRLTSGAALTISASTTPDLAISGGARFQALAGSSLTLTQAAVAPGELYTEIPLGFAQANDLLINGGTVTLRSSAVLTLPDLDQTNFTSGTLDVGPGASLHVTSGSIRLAGTLVKDGRFGDGAGATPDYLTMLTVLPGGRVTHSRGLLAGLRLEGRSIRLEPGGRVDVAAQGLLGGSRFAPACDHRTGQTYDALGNVTCTGGSSGSAGGSYGGIGGTGFAGGGPGAAYGLAEDPAHLGSGGGSEGVYVDDAHAGGNGGGLVRMVADSVIVEGEISADGGSIPGANCAAAYNGMAGGSGGGIKVVANVFRGGASGSVHANGGFGYCGDTGGGGGGRIAIWADDQSGWLGTLDVRGGYLNQVRNTASSGTIYRSARDGSGPTADLLLTNGGRLSNSFTPLRTQQSLLRTVRARNGATLAQGTAPGATVEVDQDVRVETGAIYRLDSGAALTISAPATPDLAISGGGRFLALAGSSLTLTQATVAPGELYTEIPLAFAQANDLLIGGGTVTLRSSAVLTLPDLHETNFPAGTLDVGASASLHVASGAIRLAGTLVKDGRFGDGAVATPDYFAMLTVLPGGRVTHGRGLLAGLRLEGRSIRLEPAGRIDVTGRGLLGGSRSGSPCHPRTGQTYDVLGNVTCSGGSSGSAGGSYGGIGANGFAGGVAGATYGLAPDPAHLGSGGGAEGVYVDDAHAGGDGGGLARIAVDSLIVDGEILANGASAPPANCAAAYNGMAGGSGGGIKVVAGFVCGSGGIRANGGGGACGVGGGGGGGRIAIYYGTLCFPVANLSVQGGGGGQVGGVGTIHLELNATADIAGSGSLTCDNATQPASGVTVNLSQGLTPIASTTTATDGSYSFTDLPLGTYTVAVVSPAGYATPIDTRLLTLDEGDETVTPEAFAFTCLTGDIAGRVTGTCDGQTAGLHGVTVDVYRDDGFGTDVLVAVAATDADGYFQVDNLALGAYTVGIVTPLGFSGTPSQQVAALSTPDGTTSLPSFGLTCQLITAQPRGLGYWKHQVNVYLTGKGSAQETLAQLLGYLDLMVVHFNQHVVNPVVVYVPGASTNDDKLLQLQQLLTVNRDGTMLDRAKQQLLALLLNVVSGKISQVEEISDNAATVSQAITHSYDLIVDGDPSTDETAKTICDLINNGQRVPPGMVPAGVPAYTYDPEPVPQRSIPLALGLGPIAPNPATLAGTIAFALPTDARAVLEVVDLAGRMVHREEVGSRGAGYHTVRLAELKRMPPGIYLVRLTQGRESLIKRLAVIR